MIYPKASEWYADRQQEQLLTDAESSIQQRSGENTASKEMQSVFEDVSQLLQEPVSGLTEQEDEQQRQTHAIIQGAEPIAHANQPSAIIIIDKVDLKLPILEGASLQNMKYSAVHLSETTPIGEVGNAAIAAHRARTTGRLFNRLHEVGIGDEIVIEMKNAKIIYTVYEVLIVEPTDSSVLNRNNKDKILTLITCDPIVNPTHRLIVHAKAKE